MDYVETTTTNSKIAKRTERCQQIKCDNKKRVPHQCRNVQMQQLKHDTYFYKCNQLIPSQQDVDVGNSIKASGF